MEKFKLESFIFIKQKAKEMLLSVIIITSPLWITWGMAYLSFTIADYSEYVETESQYDFFGGLSTALALIWVLLLIVSFIVTIMQSYKDGKKMLTPVLAVIFFYLLPMLIINGFLMSGVGMKKLKNKEHRSYQKEMLERRSKANISKN